jgi:hypothetical protein
MLARVSVLGVLATALGSCAPSVIGRTLAEQPVFVDLPVNGIATPAQKAEYEGNPAAVERWEGRCTYKPATGAVCNSHVTLKITVVEGAKHIRVGGHSGKALLLAVIENKGQIATFDNIMPGEQALVAVDKPDPTPGGQRQTAVMMVRFNQMMNSPNFAVSAREYGVLRTCNPHFPATSSDMSFRGCDPKHLAMTEVSRQGVLATSLVTLGMPSFFMKRAEKKSADFFSLDDPLWLRCSPGCCTS